MTEKQEEYMYDDYMPPEESLYQKFAKVVNYPYENNSTFRGMSDGADYEARTALDMSNPHAQAKLAGKAVAVPMALLSRNYYNDMDLPLRVGAAGMTGLMASSIPNPDLLDEYGFDPNRPDSKDWKYRAGTMLSPALFAGGAAGAAVKTDPALWGAMMAAPVMAGLAHPKNNPLIKIAEYLDKKDSKK